MPRRVPACAPIWIAVVCSASSKSVRRGQAPSASYNVPHMSHDHLAAKVSSQNSPTPTLYSIQLLRTRASNTLSKCPPGPRGDEASFCLGQRYPELWISPTYVRDTAERGLASGERASQITRADRGLAREQLHPATRAHSRRSDAHADTGAEHNHPHQSTMCKMTLCS